MTKDNILLSLWIILISLPYCILFLKRVSMIARIVFISLGELFLLIFLLLVYFFTKSSDVLSFIFVLNILVWTVISFNIISIIIIKIVTKIKSH